MVSKKVRKGLNIFKYGNVFKLKMFTLLMAKQMLEAMKRYNKNVGAIVFGSEHTDGLIKELRKLGDFNIIVVP